MDVLTLSMGMLTLMERSLRDRARVLGDMVRIRTFFHHLPITQPHAREVHHFVFCDYPLQDAIDSFGMYFRAQRVSGFVVETLSFAPDGRDVIADVTILRVEEDKKEPTA